MNDPCDAWEEDMLPKTEPRIDYASVAEVLRWCAKTGSWPHQDFKHHVEVTNTAGRLWNEWQSKFPALRSIAFRMLAAFECDLKLATAKSLLAIDANNRGPACMGAALIVVTKSVDVQFDRDRWVARLTNDHQFMTTGETAEDAVRKLQELFQ